MSRKLNMFTAGACFITALRAEGWWLVADVLLLVLNLAAGWSDT